MKLTNMNHIDFSFILPSFVISRKRKQLLKVKGRRKNNNSEGFMLKVWPAPLSGALFPTINNYCVYCGCHI